MARQKQSISVDVSIFEPLAYKLALKHIWRMPPAYQAWLSVDDCVQQVLLHLHRVLNRIDGRKAKHDVKQSKLLTYVFTIVDRYFFGISIKFQRKRLAADIVSIEEYHEIISDDIARATVQEINEAKEHVIRLHLMASADLVQFLDVNLYHRESRKIIIPPSQNDYAFEYNSWTGRTKKRKLTKREAFTRRKIEFRKLAEQTQTTIDMYRLALATEPRGLKV